MLYIVWLVLLFLVGAAVGSFLNVCIYRLPLEKSLIWPGSRCGNCLRPIRWRDNIPLLSYLLLRGRCRKCGAEFSPQYFAVELLTGLSFAGLFYAVVILNVHGFVFLKVRHDEIVQFGVVPWQAWAVYVHHALLLSFLIVATVCDLRSREIPLSVTMPGAVVGLLSAVLWPWPWPYEMTPVPPQWLILQGDPWEMGKGIFPPQGVYPWPVWGPLPEFLEPGGNWQTGLATGLAGMLTGTFMLRGLRTLFSKAMGVEAMGLGDADIMMMAGCFLGWQPVIIAFFLSIFPALLFGLVQLVMSGDNAIPFGPALAVGVMGTWLGWAWVAPSVQILFFNGPLMVGVILVCTLFLGVAGLMLRARRYFQGE